jgi:hypothetical protein
MEASETKPFAQRLDEQAAKLLDDAPAGDVVLADAIVIHARAVAALTEAIKAAFPAAADG